MHIRARIGAKSQCWLGWFAWSDCPAECVPKQVGVNYVNRLTCKPTKSPTCMMHASIIHKFLTQGRTVQKGCRTPCKLGLYPAVRYFGSVSGRMIVITYRTIVAGQTHFEKPKKLGF